MIFAKLPRLHLVIQMRASTYFHMLQVEIFYGGRHMDEVEFEDKVKFTDDLFSDQTPKLSIHESGQVHIKVKDSIAGPVLISPLSEWKGQHIASVSIDHFSSLSEFRGSISDDEPCSGRLSQWDRRCRT